MSTTRGQFPVVWLTVFIDLIGFGLIMPIMPYYAQEFGVQGLGFGALIGVYSFMQFISTQILGRLSDRYGRRPLMLVSILFSGAGYVLFALSHTYWLLFLARMISGFSAGNMSVAQAYVADITTAADRSRAMGKLGAAFGLGFVVGPALGGFAAGAIGPTAPVWTAAALCAINLVSAWFLLPESLHADHRTRKPLFDLGHLGRAFGNPQLAPVMGWWVFAPLGFSGYMVTIPLYMATVFAWTANDLGWFFALVGITAASVQGFLFGKLVRVTGDRALMIAGTAGMVVTIAAVPFLPTAALVYLFTFLLAFANSVAVPAVTGMVSRFAGVSEQGTMLGAAHAIGALGRLVGPLGVGQVYDVVGPRAAFLVAAALMAIAWTSTTRVPLVAASPAASASPAPSPVEIP